MPRALLQSMPEGWQREFVRLLDMYQETWEKVEFPDYIVSSRKDGKFITDPIPHYSKGRTRVDPTTGKVVEVK